MVIFPNTLFTLQVTIPVFSTPESFVYKLGAVPLKLPRTQKASI